MTREPIAPPLDEWQHMTEAERAAVAKKFADWRAQGGEHVNPVPPHISRELRERVQQEECARERHQAQRTPESRRWQEERIALEAARPHVKQDWPKPEGRTPAPDKATRERMRAGLDARIAESRIKGFGVARFPSLKIKSHVDGERVGISTPWYSRIFRVGK